MKEFSKRLKKALIDADISQLELSELLPADYRSISAWCNGRYYPQTNVLIRICEVLNVSADYLLGLEKNE